MKLDAFTEGGYPLHFRGLAADMIASLPMYQRPELTDQHARYWALIRAALYDLDIQSPAELSQGAEEFATWTDPQLVLSQTCGMPYRNTLRDKVQLVGTPDFGVEGCHPGYYRSAFIVRRDDRRQGVEDFATATFSYNQDHSQSGYAAAYNHTTALGFWFERRFYAGQHLASADAVAASRADIAAIDAVSWRLIERYEPFACQLRVLTWTEPTPGLPYITRLGSDAAMIFSAVAHAVSQLSQQDRSDLGIAGLVPIPAADYLSIPNPPIVGADDET